MQIYNILDLIKKVDMYLVFMPVFHVEHPELVQKDLKG